jgi:hypothetical protein
LIELPDDYSFERIFLSAHRYVENQKRNLVFLLIHEEDISYYSVYTAAYVFGM